MNYRSGYYKGNKKRGGAKKGIGKFSLILFFGCLMCLFALWLIFFGSGNENKEEEIVEEIELMQEFEDEIIDDMNSPEEVNEVGVIDDFEEVGIRGRGGYISSGVIRRKYDDMSYRVVIVADLPPQQDEYYKYTAWMVRPGIMEHFSIGDMFKRADGRYGLLHESFFPNMIEEVEEYTRLIITRELRGQTGPSTTHVAQADFE